jgi:p24 family protein beta-1
MVRATALAGLLAAAAGLFSAAAAHNIQLPAHGRECFHETLHRDDKMTVTFQVGDREFGSAGNLDIDFWVSHKVGPGGSRETDRVAVGNWKEPRTT